MSFFRLESVNKSKSSNKQFNQTAGTIWRVYVPVSSGRRRCMGEQLVRNELFYFTANLVQRYRVEALNGVLPDTTPDDTSTARLKIPSAFKAVFIKL